ncbi:hypothetical protein JCM1841_000673 [Sporobolomyces salmonicolor]
MDLLPRPPALPNGLASTSPPDPSPAPPPHPPDPREPDLDRELPVVLDGQIPLAYLVDRVVAQAYSDLANLVETLPSSNDQQRKRAIIDYVLHTRRQVLKLLVLARWSTEAHRVQKAMNIIGLLTLQNHALSSSISSLTSTVSSLSSARVRNYDLPTSLSVLSTGTYSGLPSGISEAFEGQEKLTDDDVVRTMRECERVMRWRLRMGMEGLPRAMQHYRIADGRVTFSIPGLWEASFVYSGSREGGDGEDEDAEEEEGAEWYLLSVKFLFRVKDSRGTWAPVPLGPLKQHLTDACNAELARRPFLLPPPEPPATLSEGELPPNPEEEEGNERKRAEKLNDLKRKRRRDRPLRRGYAFLQRLALSYQLESIYSQAVRLAGTSWNGSLNVEMSTERDEVRVGYWHHAPDNAPQASSSRQPPPPAPAGAAAQSRLSGPGGTLVFSLRPSPPSSPETANPLPPPSPSTSSRDRTSAAREQALQAALALAASPLPSSSNALDPPPMANGIPVDAPTPRSTHPSASPAFDPDPAHEPDHADPTLAVPSQLSVTWLLPPSFSALSAGEELTLNEDLDVELLLWRVTTLHAGETVRRLAEEVQRSGEKDARLVGDRQEEVEQDGMDVDSPSVSSSPHNPEPLHLLVPLQGPYALTAHIVPSTGRFELRPASLPSPSSVSLDPTTTDSANLAATTSAREARFRSAAERIDQQRFAAPPPPGVGANQAQRGSADGGEAWMRGVGEIVARIRASTVLDELETLFSLLSLPTLRRLPLPPRELAKFAGPNPALLQAGRSTFLFVPLALGLGGDTQSASGLEGYYLAMVLFEDGLRAALVATREAGDGVASWVEISEVGWVAVEEQGKAEAAGKGARTTNLGFEVGAERLRGVWRYCVHRVALFQLEQQLSSRRIPYRTSASSSSSSAAAASAQPAPFDLSTSPLFLVLQAKDLLRPGSAAAKGIDRLVYPNVALRCAVGDDGVVRTTLHVRFRRRPFSSLSSSSPGSQRQLSLNLGANELPQNVLLNPKQGILVFLVEGELLSCVERLLRAHAAVVQQLATTMTTSPPRREPDGQEKD